jgi:hypothetical protein
MGGVLVLPDGLEAVPDLGVLCEPGNCDDRERENQPDIIEGILVEKSVIRNEPSCNGGMSVARMPSAPMVKSFRLRAERRRISVAAMEASTK